MAWKDVPGYEGRYQVSDEGQVKSLPNKTRSTELILKQSAHIRSGHMIVNLTYEEGGKWRQRAHYVHVLMLTAFVGFPPAGKEGCHDDGDPANNRLGNVYWGTRQDNMKDRQRHGTDNAGERNGKAKLTEAKVKDIKARLAKGEKVKDLAAESGVSVSAIKSIKNGQRWSHV